MGTPAKPCKEGRVRREKRGPVLGTEMANSEWQALGTAAYVSGFELTEKSVQF